MLWYSVGKKEDFDYFTGSQLYDSGFSSIQPYMSALFEYGQNGYINLTEDVPELWIALNFTSLQLIFNGTSILELFDASLNSLLKIGHNGGNLSLWIAGTLMQDLTLVNVLENGKRLELHYLRTSTSVTVDIWQEDILMYSYTGPTGAGTAPVHRIGQGVNNYCRIVCWDYVVSTEGRVKGMKPVIVAMSGIGAKNTASVIEYVGNATSATSGTMATGTTVLVNAAPATPGKINYIIATFTTSGTAYVGVLTKNASDPTKYTLKYVSGAISVAAQETTLTAGIDFATLTDWELTADDRIAIFCTNSAVLAYGSGPNSGYTYSGNAMADSAEKTFAATSNGPCLRAKFYVDDKTRSYMITDATSELVYSAYEESNHYLEGDEAGKGILCNINHMPKANIYIKSLKVAARGVTGSNITKAALKAQIGTDALSSTVSLPSSTGQVTAQFEGQWETVDFNAAQIGFDFEE